MSTPPSDNPFLNRLDKKAVQSKGYWRAKRQEKAIARTISGSGSGRKKGDVEVMDIARLECKTTQNKSFSVTREMVEKITNAGIGSGEVPAIVIEFLDQRGTPESSVCVVPLWALEMLIRNQRRE
jgi:hypothetical protein